jgi:hypothetical protein
MVQYNLVERKPSVSSNAQSQPTLGVIEALSAGLDAVLRHPWLLLIPVVMDLFLWVGPRLQAPGLYGYVEPTLRQMSTSTTSSETRYAAQELGKMIQHFFTQYNLFAWLSVALVGVPVINGGIEATLKLVTGSGPLVWQVNDAGSYLFMFALFTTAGLFIAALFWTMLAGDVQRERVQAARLFQHSFEMWKQLLLLMVVVVSLALMSIFPLSMVMVTLSFFSVGLASFVPLLAMGVVVWALLMCLFTPHGLALYHMSLSRAISTSILVVRANFAPTAGLLVIGIALTVGLGLLWESLAADSWLRLVAIAGIAIVGTGLIVASLLFYQNRVTILYGSHHWPIPAGS